MASEQRQNFTRPAENAIRTLDEVTSDLQNVSSELKYWDDSVGKRANACFDRLFHTWRNHEGEDRAALKRTAEQLASCADQAEGLQAELHKLSILIMASQEAVDHG